MKAKKTPSKKVATKGQKPRRLAPVPGSGTLAARIIAVMKDLHGSKISHRNVANSLAVSRSRVVMEMNRLTNRGMLICHERAKNAWGVGIYSLNAEVSDRSGSEH